MGSCGRCILSLGNLCLWLAIVASIIALFAPFWVTSSNYSQGLFLACDNPYKGEDADCKWAPTDGVPDWMRACQGLWAGGTALLFLIGIFSFFLCCESCQKASCSSIIMTGNILAALSLIAGIILYGIKWDDAGVKLDRNADAHFDWGYYVAIIAAAFSVLSFLFFGCTICCLRKK